MKRIKGIFKILDRKLNKYIRNKMIKSNDFTIISDNCWSSFVYKAHNVKYATPTIGLFILSDDYIKMLENLRYYMSTDLTFIKPINSKNYDRLKNRSTFGSYPIGKIDDIEIYFMHYKNEKEAYNKWMERRKRINWDKLLIKMNDQNFFSEEYIPRFKQLPYENKYLFTAKDYDLGEEIVFIEKCKGMETVDTYLEPYKNTKDIKITKILREL